MGRGVDRFNLRWLYAAAFALWSLAQGLTGLRFPRDASLFRVILALVKGFIWWRDQRSACFPLRERGCRAACSISDPNGLVLEG